MGLLVLFFFILAYRSEQNAEKAFQEQNLQATAAPYSTEDTVLEAWSSGGLDLRISDSMLYHPNGTQIRYEMETEDGFVRSLKLHVPTVAMPKETESFIGEGLYEQSKRSREALVFLLEITFPLFRLPLSEVESFVYECEQTLEDGRVYTLTGTHYFVQAYREDYKIPATLMISVRRCE